MAQFGTRLAPPLVAGAGLQPGLQYKDDLVKVLAGHKAGTTNTAFRVRHQENASARTTTLLTLGR
jgi:hypothetical protein